MGLIVTLPKSLYSPEMKLKAASRFFLFGALLWAGLMPLPSGAHGPYDNSARLILHDDNLELVVTLGNEAAARFLKGGPTEALLSHGPSSVYPLAPEIAASLGSLTAAGAVLEAQQVAVHADGLEAAFTVKYPRPAAGPVSFHPGYFRGIEEMKPGLLEFMDENGNRLGAAVLNRGIATTELPWPSVAGTETGQPAPVHSISSDAAMIPQSASTPETGAPRWQAVGPLAVLIAAGLLISAATFWCMKRFAASR
jgi:hypothetical protein